MTRKITLTAMLVALGTVFLFLTNMLPYGTVTLLCAASACVALTVMECGLGCALLAYLAISAFGFLLVSGNAAVFWEFVLVLGYYPVVKCLIERLNRLWLEWMIKILFFAAISVLLLLLFHFVLFLPIPSKFPVWLYGIGGVALLCVYDYALSMLLSYYHNQVKGKLKKRN